jgi:hypothetical protein
MSFRIAHQQLNEYRTGLLRGDLSYVLAAAQTRAWLFDAQVTAEQRRVTSGFLDQVVRYLARKPEANPDGALAAIENARQYWSTGRPRA